MKETDSIALPIGQHLSIMAEIDGKEISRSYTPISSNQDKGYFDLLVKASKDGDAILLNFFARHVRNPKKKIPVLFRLRTR